jgi:hypothetical protein
MTELLAKLPSCLFAADRNPHKILLSMNTREKIGEKQQSSLP